MLIVEVAAAVSEPRGSRSPRGRAQSGFSRRGEGQNRLHLSFLFLYCYL